MKWLWVVPLWAIAIFLGFLLVDRIPYEMLFYRYIVALEENNEHRQFIEEHFTVDEWISMMYKMRDIDGIQTNHLKNVLGVEYFQDLNDYLKVQPNQEMVWWLLNSSYFPKEELDKIRNQPRTVKYYKNEMERISKKNQERKIEKARREAETNRKWWYRYLWRTWPLRYRIGIPIIVILVVLFFVSLRHRLKYGPFFRSRR